MTDLERRLCERLRSDLSLPMLSQAKVEAAVRGMLEEIDSSRSCVTAVECSQAPSLPASAPKGKPLKVFGGCFDGVMRLVVAAPSQGVAAKAFGVTPYLMREYASETGNEAERAAALSKPGVVFSAPMSMHDDHLVEGQHRWRRGDPWPPLDAALSPQEVEG